MKFFPHHQCSSSEKQVLSADDIKKLLQQAELCLISIPSIGNVGQLAMDYLIAGLSSNHSNQSAKYSRMEKLGYLETGFLLPLVGNDPYHHPHHSSIGKVHSALEVYSLQFQSENNELIGPNIIFIHCRSIIIYPTLFVRDLNEWIAKGNSDDPEYFLKNLQSLVVLSSANAAFRDDRLIQGLQTESEFGMTSIACNLAIVDENQFPLNEYLANVPRLDAEKYPMFLSGVNKKLLENEETLSENGESSGVVRKLNRAIVFMICSEGENSMHGIFLSKVITAELLLPYHNRNKGNVATSLSNVNSIDWKLPYSWRHFFGAPSDDTHNLYN